MNSENYRKNFSIIFLILLLPSFLLAMPVREEDMGGPQTVEVVLDSNTEFIFLTGTYTGLRPRNSPEWLYSVIFGIKGYKEFFTFATKNEKSAVDLYDYIRNRISDKTFPVKNYAISAEFWKFSNLYGNTYKAKLVIPPYNQSNWVEDYFPYAEMNVWDITKINPK